MSDFLERINKLSPKRLALLALELHEQVENAEERAHAPIAVVGMGCRFPGGADDPASYWSLLRAGRDAIREVPAERWDIDAWFDPDPDAPGRMSVRHGGFLDHADGFDPAFFGIAPREALTMDPQQRLLLEVTWEALEHAGIAPARLFGTATGVFIGICSSDYSQRVIQRGPEGIDAYMASGGAHSVAAGRLSYVLGLHGPALAIDTACSSSLVALHVACQSLRHGESQIALAGGVNLMCSPETTVALTKGHMLAPDGRCKTFDASADGFARAEGCGVLVLKRLTDAVADGDRVLALIRGTAENQDGRSGGLTVPNGPAQEAVIRAALADGGLAPADISYVEAHGTGTSLGDPIEVRALAGALGPGRPANEPLLIGSVKTNLGHLESAAGVAGVMKVILSLLHEQIPPHLHFRTPSPHIAWSEYPVEVTASGRAWPRGARPRRAGVSSFGFSGTNAHVIIEEAPVAVDRATSAERPLHCVPLSARSDDALRALAAQYAEAIGPGSAISLANAAHTAGVGRSHLVERAAVVATDAAAAGAALRSLSTGEPHAAVRRGTVLPGVAPEIVFLYTGAGAQYPGMGRALYDTSPVFREAIDRCDALLGADARGRTLTSVLRESAGDGASVHEMSWTQPALFAVEYALTELWRSWGIEPAAVIGHSVGEYVAACVAGVFTLEEGLRLIAERGRLMEALPPGGAMAAVFATGDEVAAVVAPMADRLAIAAYNAPDSVVVSGDSAAVDALLAIFASRNVQGQRLFVSLAAHSPLVTPALEAMEAHAGRVEMRAPRIPVAWNLTGGALPGGGAPDARYWRDHMREPVRFADGITGLYRDGYRIFLEVGPHPTLMALAQRSLPEEGPLFLTSLRREHDDWSELLASVAELYVRGAPIDWQGLDRPYARRRVSLPTYPFERKRFWIETAAPGAARLARPKAGAHPLLGSRLATASPVFESLLAPDAPAWLGEHRVHGAVLAAAPVFLEMAQAAAREALTVVNCAVRDFVIREPLVLPSEGRLVQVQLGAQVDDEVPFTIHSRATTGAPVWTLHAEGRLDLAQTEPAHGDGRSLAELQAAMGPAEGCAAHYERLAALGIELGGAFQGLVRAQRLEGQSLAEIALPAGRERDAVAWSHPSLVDAALQAIGLAIPSSDDDDTYLLTSITRAVLSAPLPPRFWCHARLRDAGAVQRAEMQADLTLFAPSGAVIGSLAGVGLRRATRAALARAVEGAARRSDLFYEVQWETAAPGEGATASMAAPAAYVPQVRERFAALAVEHGLDVYARLLPALDRLSAGYVRAAFRELGFVATPGRVFTAEAEAARLGVQPRHARLFARLLGMLEEDGALKRDGAGYRVAGVLDTDDPDARCDALIAQFAPVTAELSTLRRCGRALARVLCGRQDPLQLLFPDGSFAEARALYVDSPYARTYNAALGEALRRAITGFPPGRRLRVLEVGGGTGGTTSYVLPLLAEERVEYTFTDLSPLFVEKAREQFAAYPFVRGAPLDIERDPVAQGFTAGSFDVVIAANVLHATADLQMAVANVRTLLASSGTLLLLEGVAPERWVDLTFGLTEGWWRFTDTTLRPSYPLITRDAWRRLLADSGFTGAATIPDDGPGARGAAQQALIVAQATRATREWTLVADRGGVAAAVARRLEARGDAVTVLPEAAPNRASALRGEVVYLGAIDLAGARDSSAPATSEALSLACEIPLEWLAHVRANDSAGRVWFVTRGAEPAAGIEVEEPEWQAPLWGLGRVFALEQPAHWGGLVDLPPAGTADALAELLIEELDAADGQDQVALRGGQRYVARLVQATAPATSTPRFRSDASYLITGGFGGLGLLVGRWMAQHGARHIALLGRHPDPASEGVRAIEALGARVISLGGDVASEPEMTALFARFGGEFPPLRGIMHTAAQLTAAPIGELTRSEVSGMLRPKVAGTMLLQRLAHDSNLDFLVLFSSTTALLGASGFAHYAAANAFLDAAARTAHRRGRRVLSVNWGTWEAMRLATEDQQREYRRSGLEPMPAADALDALGRLLAAPVSRGIVARIDWDVLKPLHEARRARPFLAKVGGTVRAPKPKPRAQAGPTFAERLANVPASARHDVLVEFVRSEVAAVLGIDPGTPIPPDTGLFELGMDSLMSVELKRRLAAGAERPLPSTLTFNYPSVGALAGFLEQLLTVASAPSEAAGKAPESEAREPVPASDAAIDSLSDSELEARLRARLEQSL